MVDAVVLGRFVEEAGYEPPQGVFEVVQDSSGVLAEGATHRWMLSEDPNDRKDALKWGKHFRGKGHGPSTVDGKVEAVVGRRRPGPAAAGCWACAAVTARCSPGCNGL